jgi:acyl carrier protein
METRIAKVMSEVLGVPEADVTPASSPESIATWDSLAHLSLVLALEAEFGVQFSADDAMRMVSAESIRTVLAEQGAELA